MKTLAGLKVIITRPETQAQRWQQQLHLLGAETVLLPMMQIVPVRSADQQSAVRHVAAQLPHYHKIIFSSLGPIHIP